MRREFCELMDRHRALIAPKFQKVLDIFDEQLADVPDVSWTRPKGGYFISLDVPKGCAKRVVALAKEAGVAADACRSDASVRERSRRPHDSHCAHLSRIGRSRAGSRGRGACVLLAASKLRS